MLHEGAANPNTKKKNYSKNAKKEVKDIVPISSLKQPEKILTVDEGNNKVILFFDIGYFVDIVLHSAKEWASNSLSMIQEAEEDIFSIARAIEQDGKLTVVRKFSSR